MVSHQRLKGMKLIVVAMVVAATCYLTPRGASGGGMAQQEDRSRIEIVGHETPTKDRFGSDDGAAFVIHFTGDIHGSLEPCG
jgi:hypothetical protein